MIGDLSKARLNEKVYNQPEINAVNSVLDKTLNDVGKNLSGAEMLEKIRINRKDASQLYKKTDASPEDLARADAHLKIANALEGALERNIPTELLDAYKNSRSMFAKSYAYENALNDATGKIDPKVLARLVKKDNALTGDIQKLANVAANFPKVMKEAPSTSEIAPHLYRTGVGGTIGGLLASSFGLPFHVGSAVGALAGELSGAAAKKALTSGVFDTVPSRIMSPVQAGSVGLSIAPTGVDILPPTPGGQAYQGRGLLSFADEPSAPSPVRVPVQEYPLEPRLRAMYERGGIQQPPTIPSGPYQGRLPSEVNPMPVLPETKQAQTPFPLLFSMAEEAPFIPGTRGASLSLGESQAKTPLPTIQYNERGLLSFAEEPKVSKKSAEMPSINFELRQEFLQRPEIVKSINAFREEAAKLQQVVDNAISPAVRDAAKSSLTNLQNEFLAGMKMMGVEKPQDAIGLVKMYESGRNRLPIVKTFDPRQRGMLQ